MQLQLYLIKEARTCLALKRMRLDWAHNRKNGALSVQKHAR
ncbi:hypothetical protein HMPREF3190_00261 [Umbribacter vaginalis]|nr:hypothetical protein HMPREF3190_00261 [Coriobacteriales bacterium DNF00809]